MPAEGSELMHVEGKAGDDVLRVNSGNGGNHHMPIMEHTFDHGKGSFNERSHLHDRVIPSLLLRRKRMRFRIAVHRLIHQCMRFHPEVYLIPIDRFPFLCEIDLAIVH